MAELALDFGSAAGKRYRRLAHGALSSRVSALSPTFVFLIVTEGARLLSCLFFATMRSCVLLARCTVVAQWRLMGSHQENFSKRHEEELSFWGLKISRGHNGATF